MVKKKESAIASSVFVPISMAYNPLIFLILSLVPFLFSPLKISVSLIDSYHVDPGQQGAVPCEGQGNWSF